MAFPPLIKKSTFWFVDFLIFSADSLPPFGLFPLFVTFFKASITIHPLFQLLHKKALMLAQKKTAQNGFDAYCVIKCKTRDKVSAVAGAASITP